MMVGRPQTVTSDPLATDIASQLILMPSIPLFLLPCRCLYYCMYVPMYVTDNAASIMALLHRRLLNDPILDPRAEDASMIDERTRLVAVPSPSSLLADVVIRKQMILSLEHNISMHVILWPGKDAAMASCPRINWRPLIRTKDPLPYHIHILNVQVMKHIDLFT
jgi:hypothetical protein